MRWASREAAVNTSGLREEKRDLLHF